MGMGTEMRLCSVGSGDGLHSESRKAGGREEEWHEEEDKETPAPMKKVKKVSPDTDSM
jgi:hypothetical protein